MVQQSFLVVTATSGSVQRSAVMTAALSQSPAAADLYRTLRCGAGSEFIDMSTDCSTLPLWTAVLIKNTGKKGLIL